MSLDSVCTYKKELPFTINIAQPQDREIVEKIGQVLAQKSGLNYEGYGVCTVEPYSLEKARPILYFD